VGLLPVVVVADMAVARVGGHLVGVEIVESGGHVLLHAVLVVRGEGRERQIKSLEVMTTMFQRRHGARKVGAMRGCLLVAVGARQGSVRLAHNHHHVKAVPVRGTCRRLLEGLDPDRVNGMFHLRGRKDPHHHLLTGHLKRKMLILVV